MLKRICHFEKIDFSEEILTLIAHHSEHSFRDAAKILEEINIQKIKSISEVENYLGLRGKGNLLEIIEKKDVKQTFIWLDQFSEAGGNFKNLIEEMLEELRLQLLLKKGVIIDDVKTSSLTLKQIVTLIKLLMDAYQNLKSTPIDSLPLEIALSEFYNVV